MIDYSSVGITETLVSYPSWTQDLKSEEELKEQPTTYRRDLGYNEDCNLAGDPALDVDQPDAEVSARSTLGYYPYRTADFRRHVEYPSPMTPPNRLAGVARASRAREPPLSSVKEVASVVE